MDCFGIESLLVSLTNDQVRQHDNFAMAYRFKCLHPRVTSTTASEMSKRDWIRYSTDLLQSEERILKDHWRT